MEVRGRDLMHGSFVTLPIILGAKAFRTSAILYFASIWFVMSLLMLSNHDELDSLDCARSRVKSYLSSDLVLQDNVQPGRSQWNFLGSELALDLAAGTG